MEKVTKYVAKNGREFLSREECENHEVLLNEIEYTMKLLVEVPSDCDFANGGGYIQQDLGKVEEVKKLLMSLISEHHSNLSSESGYYVIGRTLDDSQSVLYSPYIRLFAEIDEKGREWGLPYYRNNPHKAKNICLNP